MASLSLTHMHANKPEVKYKRQFHNLLLSFFKHGLIYTLKLISTLKHQRAHKVKKKLPLKSITIC